MHELRQQLQHHLAAILGVHHAQLEFAMLSTPKVADGTTVVAVSASTSRPQVVVLCSAPGFSDAVAVAMNRAGEIKEMLGAGSGDPILDPLGEGRIRGMSYSVMPYCKPLSDNRPLWWLQRATLTSALLHWLRRAEERTACAVDANEAEDRFVVPLRHMVGLSYVNEGVRAAAAEALVRLESGVWTPRLALMHGDLWKANVLLKPGLGFRRWPLQADGFAVIDWGGALIKGHGIFDLVRLAQSLRLGNRALRREVALHCQILSCDLADARSHLLVALGYFAMHLGCLPMARYARMADACVLTLERATTNFGRR